MIRALLVLFFVGFVTAPALFADSFELKPKKIKVTSKNVEVFPELELRAQDSLGGVLREPKYKSRNPQRFSSAFGDDGGIEVSFGVDEKRPGKGFDSLWADITGKGDLAKGKRVSGKPQLRGSTYEDTTFKPFEIAIPTGDDSEDFPVQARFSVNWGTPGAGEPEDASLYLTALSAMEGTVELGGQKQTMMVFDANCNGVFGEKASAGTTGSAAKGDRIWLGSGTPKPEDAYVEALPVGKYIPFGGKYYEVSFPDNTTVEINQAEVPMGRIKVDSPGFLLELAQGGDVLCVSGGQDTEVDIPAGDYKVVVPNFRLKGKGGIWELEGSPGSCKAAFAVEEGQVTEVAIGPPLKIVIDTTMSRSGSGYVVSLKFRIEGSQGEEYKFLRKNGRKVKLPALSVRNDRGKEVKKGHFEYG